MLPRHNLSLQLAQQRRFLGGEVALELGECCLVLINLS